MRSCSRPAPEREVGRLPHEIFACPNPPQQRQLPLPQQPGFVSRKVSLSLASNPDHSQFGPSDRPDSKIIGRPVSRSHIVVHLPARLRSPYGEPHVPDLRRLGGVDPAKHRDSRGLLERGVQRLRGHLYPGGAGTESDWPVEPELRRRTHVAPARWVTPAGQLSIGVANLPPAQSASVSVNPTSLPAHAVGSSVTTCCEVIG